jgi:hypothetical protein|tara:strand:+ start:2501 stop:2698 length:198 start_codon:yes stop_codon:yes gene_type:complete
MRVKDKIVDIETMRDSRINFSHKGKEYSINVTNDNELRLSVIDDILILKPVAANCVLFENKRWNE